MPSTSKKQARTMAAVAHGWKPPASSGISIPMKVAKEFNTADVQRMTANKLRSQKKAG
jgi:hypothetical protein